MVENKVFLETPIVFIDFDGVLQTPAIEQWQEMEHCEGLQSLLDANPSVRLVITTAQRSEVKFEQLKQMLPESMQPYVLDATPVLVEGRSYGGRQREVERWLADNPRATNWVAVDDEFFMYDPQCPKLVLTSKYVGWDSATTIQVCDKLGLVLPAALEAEKSRLDAKFKDPQSKKTSTTKKTEVIVREVSPSLIDRIKSFLGMD